MKSHLSTLIVIAAILLVGKQGSAQWNGMTNDPAATKILDKLKAEYESYSSIKVDFELLLELPEAEPEVQKGSIGQKGDKYYLVMDDQEIYSDGQSIWLYLKDNEEVQLNNVEEDDEASMLSPKDMMRIYESDDFIYAITDEKSVNGVPCTQIEFKPVGSDSEYSKMRLLVDTKANKMKSLKVFSKDGSRYTLTVDHILPNESFQESDFVFDPEDYPGIHIEDLRID